MASISEFRSKDVSNFDGEDKIMKDSLRASDLLGYDVISLGVVVWSTMWISRSIFSL